MGEKTILDLSHVKHQIGYHPEYLKEFLKTERFLMRGDGPLRYDYRHYIAIMAAARHNCTPLINFHKKKFASEGGNLQWLQGLQHIPQKLRNLNEINKLLAHTPWLLKKSHIEKVTRGKDSWSIGELCQIVVLMAHFHCLCSFVFASQILKEIDDGSTIRKQNAVIVDDDDDCYEEAQETVEELMEKMSILQMKDKFSPVDKTKNCFESSAEVLKTESEANRFLDDASSPNTESETSQGNITSDFLIQDCTWDDHAYSLLNRFYDDVGTVLDEKFKVAYDLTYYTCNFTIGEKGEILKGWAGYFEYLLQDKTSPELNIEEKPNQFQLYTVLTEAERGPELHEVESTLKGMKNNKSSGEDRIPRIPAEFLKYGGMGHKKNVDTTIFRRAVWNYIHRIYGIIHDDYNYEEIEDLLEGGFRTYVETVCFYPEKITKNALDEIMRAFRHSEKVHVNLMLFEARLQAELLYALSAIMRYMT